MIQLATEPDVLSSPACTVRKVRISFASFLLESHVPALPPKDCDLGFHCGYLLLPYKETCLLLHFYRNDLFIHMIYMRILCFIEFIIL